MEKLKSFTSSSLFLPIVALAVLLIFNGIFVSLIYRLPRMVDFLAVLLIFLPVPALWLSYL